MNVYTLELTFIEEKCGVTLEQVAELLPKCTVRNGLAIIPADCSPALTQATARCALAGEVEFMHLANSGNWAIYRLAKNQD